MSRVRRNSRQWALGFGAVLAFLLLTGPAFSAETQAERSTEEIMRLGERMYREGILPSGESMQAFVSGDVPVDGTAFTCVSCHLRSGLGSIEGEVITPPTNGRILYQPRESFIQGSAFVPSYANYAKYLAVRPAYTDQTLASLLVTGIDPTGRSVLEVMPRYEINDQDMTILIAYLKALSDQPSPGVGENHLSFATVIVEGADPVAVASMVQPLQFSVDRKNSLAAAAKANDRVARMAYNMLGDLQGYTFSLSRWVLTGAPETWREQLEDYYRQEPVFALLGGTSPGTWEPVHRFCEEHQIPDLFPIVDQPVLSDSDWYTLYLSRGLRQEGESAANYLKGMSAATDSVPVKILFASRLLREKGIVELLAAARILRTSGVNAEFLLAGGLYPGNPSSLSESDIATIKGEGIVSCLGHIDDMHPLLAAADIVVLPSYREGTPRILIEAAAMGTPIVATDIAGCLGLVQDGVNGFLVPVQDATALAATLQRLIADRELRQVMGAAGRAIVVAEFDEEIVLEKTLAVYRELL